jgi:hypothetical protein
MILIAAAAFLSAPLAAQYSAGGMVTIVVPSVAGLALQDATPIATHSVGGGMVEASGSLVVRVRANHGWRVFIAGSESLVGAGPDGGAELEWRAVVLADEVAGQYTSLSPGATAVVATGGRGEQLIRIDYRWRTRADRPVDAIPLTYTLASR